MLLNNEYNINPHSAFNETSTHTHSHALLLSLLDFSKSFPYASHYFNTATAECFCLFTIQLHNYSLSPACNEGISVSQKNSVLFNQGSLLLDYSTTHKERPHEEYLWGLFSTIRGCTWKWNRTHISGQAGSMESNMGPCDVSGARDKHQRGVSGQQQFIWWNLSKGLSENHFPHTSIH